MAGHPMFNEMLKEMQELHNSKNHDYAGENPLGNLEMCEAGGIPAWKGVIVRLTDKMARLLTFCRKEEYLVKDESVEDTFRDMSIYAILGLILYRTRREENEQVYGVLPEKSRKKASNRNAGRLRKASRIKKEKKNDTNS